MWVSQIGLKVWQEERLQSISNTTGNFHDLATREKGQPL
jgi:hypothetical protein